MINRDENSIKMYFSELRKDKRTQPLTKTQEKELYHLWLQTGDDNIKTRIILSNTRIVVSLASKYVMYNSKCKVEDLINEGNEALIMCFDKYNVNSDASFNTFCQIHINNAMRQYTQFTCTDIKESTNIYSILKYLRLAETQLHLSGKIVNDMEILKTYHQIKPDVLPKVSMHRYNEIINYKTNVSSLSSQVYSDDSNVELVDTIGCADISFNTDSNIIRSSNDYIIEKVLNTLNSKERFIIKHTFGLLGCETLVLDQISNRIGLTRERCGQILNSTLQKLKSDKKIMSLLTTI